MKIAVVITRTLMGLGFVVFGANIIHPFLPQPPVPAGSPTAQFMAVMGPTHWMALVGWVQLVGGLLLLYGGTAPLGLVMLGPVLVNILAFHICMQGGKGVVPGAAFSVIEIFLVYAYRRYFSSLFTVNASPN
jgi:putative oxidoreductase